MALKFAKLTRPAVRALAIGGKIAEHGIVVERQANGDARYSINVMVDRQRIHRVVGRESEGVTREQAERLIEKLRTEAREGGSICLKAANSTAGSARRPTIICSA